MISSSMLIFISIHDNLLLYPHLYLVDLLSLNLLKTLMHRPVIASKNLICSINLSHIIYGCIVSALFYPIL
jgi:hypothetical protein